MRQQFYYISLMLFLSGCQWFHQSEKASTAVQPTMTYQCPMPQDSVFTDHPGECPKCGMTLVKIQTEALMQEVDLDDLLKPTNEFVVSNIKMTGLQKAIRNWF